MTTAVDPQLVLAPRFQAAIAAAFGDEHRDADPMLRASDRADLQANVAMGLAKRVGQPPRKVAEAILSRLDAGDVLERVELAGPGFFNLWLRADWLAGAAARALSSERLAVEPAAAP
ncbi:MAG: arginine--tRNA ligase, partial [Polyangiaceae bacterium]|nr:arginine--tRNA ligase [Polyangiaceae bacterium]